MELVQDVNAGNGVESKIRNVIRALEAGNIDNACSLLASTAEQVQSRRGKHIAPADADEILLRVSRARAELGC